MGAPWENSAEAQPDRTSLLGRKPSVICFCPPLIGHLTATNHSIHPLAIQAQSTITAMSVHAHFSTRRTRRRDVTLAS
jgi:hypothetical protein